MHGSLFLDIVIVLAGGFAGGLIARQFHFPILLGYLIAGAIVGPHVLGAVGNLEEVRTLAEFGVVLLLFEVGVEVSLRELRRAGKVIVLGGIVQMLATIGLMYPLAIYLGWPFQQALVFGMVASLSSTMVVLKTLADRGELGSVHGKVMVGILIMQDLAFIPMIAILPSLSGEGTAALSDLGFGVLKAAVILVLMVVLGGRAIPWVLDKVPILSSKEVFILTVVALTFAAAALTDAFGLTLAIGAFAAGLVLSESPFGRRALSEVIPLRDIFAAVFFVSLGMLTDPRYVVDHIGLVLIVVSAVMLVKLILIGGLVKAFGYLPYTAVLTGLGMMQVGEFSFFLADAAYLMDIVDLDFLTLIVVSTVITMALTPLVFAGGVMGLERLGRLMSVFREYSPAKSTVASRIDDLSSHLVLCGMGNIGLLVAEELREHEIPFAVIELDPHIAQRSLDSGYLVLNGSSTSRSSLEQAGIDRARMMVITTGDTRSARDTARRALEINPKLEIVARVRWQEDAEALDRIGVHEVVWPEMEAGQQILRHSLLRYEVDIQEVDSLVAQLRSYERISGDPADEADLSPEEQPEKQSADEC